MTVDASSKWLSWLEADTSQARDVRKTTAGGMVVCMAQLKKGQQGAERDSSGKASSLGCGDLAVAGMEEVGFSSERWSFRTRCYLELPCVAGILPFSRESVFRIKMP